MEPCGTEFDSQRVQDLITLCEKHKGLYLKPNQYSTEWGFVG